MKELRQIVFAEAKHQLQLNLDLLKMLQGNTPLETIAAVREEWVEPLARLVGEQESGRRIAKPNPAVS